MFIHSIAKISTQNDIDSIQAVEYFLFVAVKICKLTTAHLYIHLSIENVFTGSSIVITVLWSCCGLGLHGCQVIL